MRRWARRFEPLEQRRLLALTNMGEVFGTVFLDIEGNGLTPGDPRLPGVTVELYEETSGSGFDPLVDTLVDSKVSDLDGEYVFENLTAAPYWVYQATDPMSQLPIHRVQQVIITDIDAQGVVGQDIDQFDDVAQFVQITLGSTEQESWDSSLDTSAIGGERDLYVWIDPVDAISLSVDNINHHITLSCPGSVSDWVAKVVWDGPDGDPLGTDATGLGGVDMTRGGSADGLSFNMGGDSPTVATFHFHTDATHWSTVDIDIPVTGAAGTPDITAMIPFDSLAEGLGADGPADLTNIGALEMEIVDSGGRDINFEWIVTVGPTRKTIDIQNFEPLTLGDLVFEDLNNNGLFDSGTETGIEGVEVSLWLDANANGLLDGPGIDMPIGVPTFTDVDGLFHFNDLVPGDYITQIGSTNFDVGEVLEGYSSSAGANDPDDDVNNDDNGFMVGGLEVRGMPITLTIGGEPIDDGDTDANTNLTLDFGFVPDVDLVVDKVVQGGASQFIAGDSFSYTVTVENQGLHTADHVVLVDTLPVGMTLDATSPAYDNYDPGTRQIRFNLDDLASSANRTFAIDVTLDTNASGLLTNNALATTTVFESDTSNNFALVDINATLVVDLSINKVDRIDPLLPGETLIYDILVTNDGPSTATGVTVVDTLPAGVTFVSATPTETSYDAETRQLTFDLPDMTRGDSDSISIAATVDSDVVGTLVNTVNVTATENDSDSSNNTSTEETTIDPIYGLMLTKGVSHAVATPDMTLTYTIDVDNLGTGTTTGVTVIDTLPDGVTFTSAAGATVMDVIGQQVTFDLGSLASGETRQVTLDATIDASTVGTLTNTSVVTLNETENGGNTAADNTDTADTLVQAAIDLSINKVDRIDPLLPGETLIYDILVTNDGPSTATGVTVVDTLPAGVTFVSATPTETSYDAETRQLTFDLPDMTRGDSDSISIAATVDSDVVGTLVNTVNVTATENDSDSSNNTSTEETTIDPIYGLMLTKGVSHAVATPDMTLTYTIDVDNLGTGTTTGVTVIDTLPDGVTFTSAAGATVMDVIGQQVTFDLGSLASGETRQVTLDATIDASTVGTLTNTSVVTLNETENGGNTAADNTDTADTLVQAAIDLSINKVDRIDPLLPGETLTYDIRVANNGSSTATSVTVVDSLPLGVTFVSATPTETSYDRSTRQLTFDLPDMARGDSDSISVIVTVDSDVVGTLVNTANVTATENDSDSSNNTSTEETTIGLIHGLMLTKKVSHSIATPGTTLTYTIDVDNLGTGTTTGVTVIDTLPDGVTFTSAAGATVMDVIGQQVTFDLGSLASGETHQVTLDATIDASTVGTLTNTSVVTLNENENGGNTSTDNVDTVDTLVQAEVDLSIDKQASQTTVLPGEPFSYTLRVRNNGPSDATAVTVVDELPDEVTFDFATGSADTYDPILHEVTFDIGSLPVGDSLTLTIDGQVDTNLDPAVTDFSNRATVSSFEPEIDTTNNVDVVDVFVQVQEASIAGMVFLDLNNNGNCDENDTPLADVLISLAGAGTLSHHVDRTTRTNSDGTYQFDGLDAGTYSIEETQPDGLLDGKDRAGTAGGTVHDDAIVQISLEGGVNATDYTFAEQMISKRSFLASS